MLGLGALLGEVSAREVAGAVLPEEARLSPGGPSLRLVGAGVFRFLFLRYYVCGLYALADLGGAASILRADAPRRFALVAMRRITSFEFLWGLDKGLADNTDDIGLKAIGAQLEALRAAIREIGAIRAGSRVEIDYVPDAGTSILVGGALRGGPLGGKPLNDALMRVWIGERPLDTALKETLLGA
jgi:hypothetical protein